MKHFVLPVNRPHSYCIMPILNDVQTEWLMDNRQESCGYRPILQPLSRSPPGSTLLTVHTATWEQVLSLLYCSFNYLCVLCLQWVLPEIIATSFIPVVLLISWHWFLFLLSAPLAGYLIHRLGAILPSSHTLVRPQVVEGWLKDWLESQSLNVPSSPFPLPLTSLSHVFPPFSLPITRYVMLTPGSLGVYDATEIRNRGMLTNFTREAFIKIGYHLVMFFISLYW